MIKWRYVVIGVLAFIAVVMVFTVSGCSAQYEEEVKQYYDEKVAEQNRLVEVQKLLSDGRTVTCLISEIGLSCDWAGAE